MSGRTFDGTFVWFAKPNEQFGSIKGENGESVVFDPEKPNNLDLSKPHNGTPVTYERRKIPTIANTYFATDVQRKT